MKTKHILITYAFLLSFFACQDEEFMPTPEHETQSTAARATNVTSVLTTADGGKTWTASRRVPLVGEGRIVDDMSNALISILTGNNGISSMLDTDITNSASFKGVATTSLIDNDIASVRDINHVYTGGQNAGFVYLISETSMLTLDILKGFYLKTYLKGVQQETKGGDTSASSTLQLNLIGAASSSGQQALSITTSFNKPFDEIKIGMTGISATVLNALNLYYAFVGENPIRPAVSGNSYFTSTPIIHENTLIPLDASWTSPLLASAELTDANLTNGPSFGLLVGLTQPRVTINFKQQIPIGAEVGFNLSSFSLLDLSILGSTTLTTYDVNNLLQETVTITSLLGISAIAGGNTQVSMILKKPCTQVKIQFNGIDAKIGSTTINYAFVRDAVVVDPSSYFSMGNATTTGNAYQLKTPATGNISYVVTQAPAGATPVITNNKITGMTVNGDYQVTGTYTSADGNTIYTQVAIITCNAVTVGSGTSCNTPITLASNSASVYAPSGGGCLLCAGEGTNFTGKNNLIDNNPDNFITYNNFLSIAANTSIVGIQTATSTINAAHNQIRAGFILQTTTKLLSADALKYFLIRLYRNGTKVFESTATGNNAISAGLIGSSGSRERISVNTNVEFDAIELWTAGVLNLNLNTFRIYNAFWENTADACYSATAGDACLQLITPSSYGANINYAATGITGVATVGSSFKDLGNLMDGDAKSYAQITTTDVLGAATVAIKFNCILQKQPIGFIVTDSTGLIGANVLSWVTLTIYNDGAKVGGTESGGLLGLNVIGSGFRQYIETTPSTVPFDEVRITFSGVANALKTIQLNGLYTRQDSNGDGIPDCAETTTPVDNIDFSNVTAHVCQGSNVVITVIGGTNGNNYLLRCYNAANNNAVTDKTVTLTAQTFTLSGLTAGDYYITIYDAGGTNIYYNGIHSTVHPNRTTWKTNAATSNWNTWTNWSDGSPWQCTDVIIPSGATRYPILTNGASNYCNNLHFAPGAEIVNTHYLTYAQAWAEMALESGRYYMLSAPLKATFTGDMFIPSAMNGTQNNNFFTPLNATNSPENRFSPRVYQRLWSNDAPGKKITGGSTLTAVTVTPDKTNWTPPFNALNQQYTLGMGFSLLADKESASASTLTFRFPKLHTLFNYFDLSNQSTSYSENLTRTLPGRFIYENNSGIGTMPVSVTATNKTAGTTFLVGNPFMTHINIAQFMTDNPTVTSVKVYDGNSNNSVIKADGELLTNGSNFQYIAPMQSFFVTTNLPDLNLPVSFSQAALTQAPGAAGSIRSARSVVQARSASTKRPTLMLTATVSNTSSSCIIRLHPSAKATSQPKEDSELLFDNEVPPTIAVFSIADEKALDIQQLNDAPRIPLGFSLRTPARVTLKLSHVHGDAWKNWSLIDTQTGKRTPLSSSEITLDAGTLSTHVGRFYLEKN